MRLLEINEHIVSKLIDDGTPVVPERHWCVIHGGRPKFCARPIEFKDELLLLTIDAKDEDAKLGGEIVLVSFVNHKVKVALPNCLEQGFSVFMFKDVAYVFQSVVWPKKLAKIIGSEGEAVFYCLSQFQVSAWDGRPANEILTTCPTD